MISQMQEFVSDTSSALVDKVQKIRKGSVESAREAAVGSAEKIKSLKGPVRTFARSGGATCSNSSRRHSRTATCTARIRPMWRGSNT